MATGAARRRWAARGPVRVALWRPTSRLGMGGPPDHRRYSRDEHHGSDKGEATTTHANAPERHPGYGHCEVYAHSPPAHRVTFPRTGWRGRDTCGFGQCSWL